MKKMEYKSGLLLGDTTLTGVTIILKDGSKKFIECQPPIVLKTAEENNENYK